MESKPAETRLNYFKNFNHFNKDQEGGMEIFGQRVNTEIQRMGDEVFDDGDETEELDGDGNIVTDNNEIELSTDIEELADIDMDNPTEDSVDGLTINSDEQAIPRQHSYPYGFGTQPSPAAKSHTGIKSKTGSPILTFEEFKWDNVTIKNKEVDKDFLDKIVPKIKKKAKILDIGYGDGQEMEYLSSLGFDVVGTEIKDDYKSNLKLSKHITHDTLNDFPFRDDTFDFIYSRLSLHYFTESDLNNIFDEIKRMIKPNGYFAFTCKTDEGGYASGKKFYSLEKWVEITKDAGFDIISSDQKSGKLYGKSAKWVEIYSQLTEQVPKITISSKRL